MNSRIPSTESAEPLDPIEEKLQQLVRPAAKADITGETARPHTVVRPSIAAVSVLVPIAAAVIAIASAFLFYALLSLPTDGLKRRVLAGDPEDAKPQKKAEADPLEPYQASLADLASEDYDLRKKALEQLSAAPLELLEPFRAWAQNSNDPEAKAGMERVIGVLRQRGHGDHYKKNLGLALFTHRTGEARKKALARYGGTEETEASVQRGLAWLVAQQHEDGSWGNTAPTASTGYCLLALLGAGHSEIDGTYRGAVQKGVAFLCKNQLKTGFLPDKMYHHGIAGWALAEAAALSRKKETVAAAQNAVDLAVACQDETLGWRYLPKKGDGDLSISAWNAMFLFMAKQADLNVPDQSLADLRKLLTKYGREHLYPYSPGASPAAAMTFSGCTLEAFLGHDPAVWHPGLKWAQEQASPQGNLRSWRLYTLHWGTMAAFQQGGRLWEEWNAGMIKTFLNAEVREGTAKGSNLAGTDMIPTLGAEGATAMALLCLEAYYRYPRLDD